MAFDGMMMSQVKKELLSELKDGHINQIYQPNRDELVILFRTHSGNKKLLISTRADSPRVGITSFAPENPDTPPMLCMLLRKRLLSAKLVNITQPEYERILFFEFDSTNEIGDRDKTFLCVEIMGKYSNVILLDKEKKIIDALKRVDLSMSRERLILPKVVYELPKKQDKLMLCSENLKLIEKLVNNSCYEMPKALLNVIQGISPIICREIDYRMEMGSTLTDELKRIIDILEENKSMPLMLIREDSTPFDISFIDIKQYENNIKTKVYESFSVMLDSFYLERDKRSRMKAKTHNLEKTLSNIIERLSKKINLQIIELEKCKNREELRIKADLLQAHLHEIKKGATSVVVENFYDENQSDIEIELNPTISPATNAQKYYKAYAKAKTGESMLTKQIEKAQEDLAYIESVMDLVSRTQSEKEISLIKQELIEEGYIKLPKGSRKQPSLLPPIEYTTKDGYRVLVGRNNKQNDILTLKYAKKNDLWFHTKSIPGSHVVVETNGQEISDETIKEVAIIAATHSKARNSSNVPVDYTKIKHVSKPSGAKPGKVIYVEYRTKYVDPKTDIK